MIKINNMIKNIYKNVLTLFRFRNNIYLEVNNINKKVNKINLYTNDY
jgi:hypothetical protein